MWSNKNVRSHLKIGYHFIHNGTYHVIDRLHKNKLHCYTQEGGSYYMTYTYFQNTNHFKSRYMNFPKKRVGIAV